METDPLAMEDEDDDWGCLTIVDVRTLADQVQKTQADPSPLISASGKNPLPSQKITVTNVNVKNTQTKVKETLTSVQQQSSPIVRSKKEVLASKVPVEFTLEDQFAVFVATQCKPKATPTSTSNTNAISTSSIQQYVNANLTGSSAKAKLNGNKEKEIIPAAKKPDLNATDDLSDIINGNNEKEIIPIPATKTQDLNTTVNLSDIINGNKEKETVTNAAGKSAVISKQPILNTIGLSVPVVINGNKEKSFTTTSKDKNPNPEPLKQLNSNANSNNLPIELNGNKDKDSVLEPNLNETVSIAEKVNASKSDKGAAVTTNQNVNPPNTQASGSKTVDATSLPEKSNGSNSDKSAEGTITDVSQNSQNKPEAAVAVNVNGSITKGPLPRAEIQKNNADNAESPSFKTPQGKSVSSRLQNEENSPEDGEGFLQCVTFSTKIFETPKRDESRADSPESPLTHVDTSGGCGSGPKKRKRLRDVERAEARKKKKRSKTDGNSFAEDDDDEEEEISDADENEEMPNNDENVPEIPTEPIEEEFVNHGKWREEREILHAKIDRLSQRQFLLEDFARVQTLEKFRTFVDAREKLLSLGKLQIVSDESKSLVPGSSYLIDLLRSINDKVKEGEVLELSDAEIAKIESDFKNKNPSKSNTVPKKNGLSSGESISSKESTFSKSGEISEKSSSREKESKSSSSNSREVTEKTGLSSRERGPSNESKTSSLKSSRDSSLPTIAEISRNSTRQREPVTKSISRESEKSVSSKSLPITREVSKISEESTTKSKESDKSSKEQQNSKSSTSSLVFPIPSTSNEESRGRSRTRSRSRTPTRHVPLKSSRLDPRYRHSRHMQVVSQIHLQKQTLPGNQGPKMHECPLCKKKMVKRAYTLHLHKHLGVIFPCPVCSLRYDTSFQAKSCLQTHGMLDYKEAAVIPCLKNSNGSLRLVPFKQLKELSAKMIKDAQNQNDKEIIARETKRSKIARRNEERVIRHKAKINEMNRQRESVQETSRDESAERTRRNEHNVLELGQSISEVEGFVQGATYEDYVTNQNKIHNQQILRIPDSFDANRQSSTRFQLQGSFSAPSFTTVSDPRLDKFAQSNSSSTERGGWVQVQAEENFNKWRQQNSDEEERLLTLKNQLEAKATLEREKQSQSQLFNNNNNEVGKRSAPPPPIISFRGNERDKILPGPSSSAYAPIAPSALVGYQSQSNSQSNSHRGEKGYSSRTSSSGESSYTSGSTNSRSSKKAAAARKRHRANKARNKKLERLKESDSARCRDNRDYYYDDRHDYRRDDGDAGHSGQRSSSSSRSHQYSSNPSSRYYSTDYYY